MLYQSIYKMLLKSENRVSEENRQYMVNCRYVDLFLVHLILNFP
jgi:hypothetical protein